MTARREINWPPTRRLRWPWTARKVIADRGITEVGLAGMSDAELAGLFPDGRARVSTGYDVPDFVRVVVWTVPGWVDTGVVSSL